MKVNKVDVSDTINAYRDCNFDPNGSYTGNTIDGEPPTQDADDL